PSQALTLRVNEAPAFLDPSFAPTFTVGVFGTFTLGTRGFPKPGLTLTGGLPTGLMFVDNHNGTATLSGTPLAGTGNDYPLGLRAANGVGQDAPLNFTLTVREAPGFTNMPYAPAFTAGTPGTFTVTTRGFPPPTITVSGLPNWARFTSHPDGTAT